MNSSEHPAATPRPAAISRRRFLVGSAAITGTAAGAAVFGAREQRSDAETTSSVLAAHRPIRIESGLLTGTTSLLRNVAVYKGIPYAGSTAGENRFAAPTPAPSWSGIRRADSWGPACPQPVQGIPVDQVPTLSEDCLNLNVWTAARSSRERRPVFMWLYGGRNSAMWTSQPVYDGANLARKGVIVVTVNYRVGAFGGLATSELSDETGYNASGNWALLDQIAALKWIKRNIGAFGGDPDRVTVAGWSHGAASTYAMIDSPLAKGLFHRAQMDSGVQYTRDPSYGHVAGGYITLAAAEENGAAFADVVGASTTAQLRALPADTIAQATNNPTLPEFRYILDGHVFPRSFDDTLKTRTQNDVPVLTGNNKDENGVSLTPNVTVAQYESNARTTFGAMAEKYLALYPATTDAQANEQTNAFARDEERVSTFMWGQQWLQAGTKPVYNFYFTHAIPGNDTSSPIEANITDAAHGAEMNYVFGNLYGTDRPWTATDYRIADVISSYVANFAATGDPNDTSRRARDAADARHRLAPWPSLHASKPAVMDIGDAFAQIPAADSAAKYRFIRSWLQSQTVDW